MNHDRESSPSATLEHTTHPSEQTTSERIFVAGTPYASPAFSLHYGDLARSTYFWDRMVLLGGGIVVGFCFGVSASLLTFANHENTVNVAVALCALLVLLSAGMNMLFISRSHSLFMQVSGLLRVIAQASGESVATSGAPAVESGA